MRLLLFCFSSIAFCTGTCIAKTFNVSNSTEFTTATKKARPGDEILLEAGNYTGGITLKNINGTRKAAITIRGKQPTNPPKFKKGTEALHLSDCSYLILKNLHVSGYPGNGINIDDAGTYETPTHHILLENVTIQNTGPKGNHDALKLSGLVDFKIKNCTFNGWGGSAIDMVGCHRGVIENCSLTGAAGFTQSSGIQIKGGTSSITVKQCTFKQAGLRAINLGGSTGLQFFRPKVPDYEATDVTIAGNKFIGSSAPIAWVTAKGGHVHHNTFYYPEKWVIRILQESKSPKFKPCHGGVFENNLIIFDKRVRTFANIGPGTDAKSFRFQGNAWHDTEASRKPVLPSPEKNGVYQPNLTPSQLDPKSTALTIRDERLKNIGAHAYKPEK